MYVQSFKELIVWQRSIELVKGLYRLTNEMPREELYGLTSQMRRAAVAIPSNIAEGKKRKTKKDFLHFLHMADGSAAELETQLIIASDLYQEIDFVPVVALLTEVQKMLTIMIQRLEEGRGASKSYKLTANSSSGFTAIEMLFVILISALIMVALMRFSATGFSVSREARLQQQAVEDARVQLERIGRALREARPAQTGAYPLVEMSPQKIVFYSDVDADETTERIRYELVGNNLERGVLEPTGNPLVYDVGNEETTVVARSIRNGSTSIFTYYSGDYPADQTALSPAYLTEVKYVQFYLLIDANEAADPAPIEVLSQVQLRNLKTNLGETVE